MKILLLILLVSCATTNQSGLNLATRYCSCRGGIKNFIDYTEKDPAFYVACNDGVHSAFYGSKLDTSKCDPKDPNDFGKY